jgi:hypothetical protein
MEDEHRPLPPGWVRQYDPEAHHQFFVDTKANPPRSTWNHPHDDEQYLSTLTSSERDHIARLNRSVSLKDIEAESSDDEGHTSSAAKKVPAGTSASASGAGSASGSADPNPKGIHKFGRKMKDRLTHSTHEERERDRERRAEEERRAYEAHKAFRNAMSRAVVTQQPQFLCKDREGHDIYVEPPGGPAPPVLPDGARGYNPYAQGPYGDPNARFVRPEQPYARYPGYGYGGGYGFPLMGGFLGGAMLGGLLF